MLQHPGRSNMSTAMRLGSSFLHTCNAAPTTGTPTD